MFGTFIILHLATIVLTNAIVVKNNPNIEIVEVNPTTSKVYNLKPASNPLEKLKPILRLFFNYIMILGGWLYMRVRLN